MDFTNRVFLIIGASSGIGLKLANILHNLGATVIGTYNKNHIDYEFDTQSCDVTNESSVKKLFEYVINNHEKIDAVINCATISMDDKIEDKSYEDFMEVVGVNLGGTFLIDKYASIYMKKGTVINMSSLDGINTYSPISVDYCAAKAGVNNLTQNFALYNPNIRYIALAPAWVDTKSVKEMEPEYLKREMERINQTRLLKKEEVAMKIIEIITNSDYVSGQIIKMGDNYEY